MAVDTAALWRHTQKTLIELLAQFVILGVMLGLVGWGIEQIAASARPSMLSRINQQIDGHVEARRLSLGWTAGGPALALNDVHLFRPLQTKPGVGIKRVAVRFDIGKLLSGQLKPSAVVLDRPSVRIRWTANGQPKIVHWSQRNTPPPTWAKVNRLRDFVDAVVVHDARVEMFGPKFPGKHIVLKRLNMRLAREQDQRWRFEYSVDGPPWLPESHGHASFTGTLPKPDHAQLTIQTRAAGPLAVAHALSAQPVQSSKANGQLDIKLQGRWEKDHFVDTGVRLQAQFSANTDAPEDTKTPQVNARFKLRQKSGANHASFKLADASSNVGDLGQLEITGDVRLDQQRLQIHGQHLPGILMAQLAKRKASPISNADLSINVPRFDAKFGLDQRLRLSATFEKLRFADSKITFGPIRGRYEFSADGHTLRFLGADGTIESRRYLKGGLPIDDLGGRVSWQPSDDRDTLKFKDLSVTSGQNHLTLNGRLIDAADKPIVGHIVANVSAPQVTRLLKHTPQGPKLDKQPMRHWLGNAVFSGAVPSATIKLDGVLKDFPYADNDSDGEFVMQLNADDVTLRPKPGWPNLNDASGHMTIRNVGLKAQLNQGDFAGIPLAPSSGSIADVRKPVFAIDAQTKATRLEKLRAFILDSPLAEPIGDIVRPLHASGPTQVQADLRIPLKPGLPETQVDGQLQLSGDTLKQAAIPEPITNIRGQLSFNRRTVHADNIEATLVDMPLEADLAGTDQGGEKITIRGHAKIDRDTSLLANYIPRRWLTYMRGPTDFDLGFRVGPHGKRSPFRIRTDLSGLAVDLPAPLSKKADTKKPLAVRITPDASGVHVDYDHRLKLSARLKNGSPTQIHAFLGDDPPQPMPGPGIWIGGHTGQVDGIGWFYVVRHILAERVRNYGSSGASTALDFRGAKLDIDALRLGGVKIADLNVDARATQANNAGWAIEMAGANANGKVTIDNSHADRLRIKAALDNLALTQIEAIDEPTNDDNREDNNGQSQQSESPSTWPVLLPQVTPTELPVVDATIQQLSVDEMYLGRFGIEASAPKDGWRLSKAELSSYQIEANAQGRWQRYNGRTEAQLQLQLSGEKLPRIARSLGLTMPLQARKTKLNADLKIAPNPDGLDLRALGGNAHLELTNGSLPQVNPGPARALGLFNFSSLPSRLRLDFDDVVKPGLAFQKLVVPAKIMNGNAFFDDANMTTPSANIVSSGRVGLPSRDVNARVTVTPQVGSSLTIVSTIFGGPLAGAAMFGIQKILQEPLNKLSRVSFNIRGGWQTLAVIGQQADDQSDTSDSDEPN